MHNFIINDIINTHNEVIDENKKIIGKFYTVIKTYTNKKYIHIFRGRLKKIKYNVSTTYSNQITNYYIFDDYNYYYKNGHELILPVPYYIVPLDEPFPCYIPEIEGTGLVSTKFYERKKINDSIKQEIILFIVKKDFYNKTKIIEDIFIHKIKKFLI
jgi:hypothetical protein